MGDQSDRKKLVEKKKRTLVNWVLLFATLAVQGGLGLAEFYLFVSLAYGTAKSFTVGTIGGLNYGGRVVTSSGAQPL